MKSITCSAARANLASVLDDVCDNRSPVLITRKRDRGVVMLSMEDYAGLEETAYLLRSPANAKRLLGSVERLNAGKGRERKLKLES